MKIKISTFEAREITRKKNKKNVFLDPTISARNLIDITKALENFKIINFIYFGTFLGAFRDKKLIKHDKDTDIAVINLGIKKKKQLINYLNTHSYLVFKESDEIISAAKDGEYTDIYIFKRVQSSYHCMGFEIKKEWITKLNKISFLGHYFMIPSDPINALESLYGKSWNIPLKNMNARVGYKYTNTNSYFIFFVRNNFSFLYNLYCDFKMVVKKYLGR